MGYDPGSRSAIDVLAGQNNGQATPDTIPHVSDVGDASILAAANEKYRQDRLTWLKSMIGPGGSVPPSSLSGVMFQRDIDILQNPDKYGGINGGPYQQALAVNGTAGGAPQRPDPLAIENQQDRARLLAEASAGYAPLISQLQRSAAGQGPSAALNYFRAAADASDRRIYGDAASMRGTGGQRAAMWQAAMAKAAEQQQQSALQAASIGAQEQNQAVAGMGSALAGLTNLYGTHLYGGTQGQQGANQAAQIHADDINAGVAQSNANNATQFARGLVDAAGKAASA